LSGSVPHDIGSRFHQAFSSIFLLGYNSLSFRPNVPSWSLDIEMQFYLIAPFLVMLAARSRHWALLLCVIISFVTHLFKEAVTAAPYLIFFAIGVTAGSSKWKPSSRLAWGALAATGVLVLLCITGPLRGILLGGAHPVPVFAFNDLGCVILALALVPWAIYTTGQKASRVDKMYGDLSYIVYLMHWPILKIIDTADGSGLHRFANIMVAMAVVLLASWLIWMVVDYPINALRSNWVAGRLPKSAD